MAILAVLLFTHALILALSLPSLIGGRRTWAMAASIIAIACPLTAPLLMGAFLLGSAPYFNISQGYAYAAGALYAIGLLASGSSFIGHVRRKVG